MTEPDVVVREVGPRDGLQNVDAFFPTEAKQAWIAQAVAAGIPEIEVCSFVPPHVVPQFTDHQAIVEAAQQAENLTVAALVPNAKGAMRGFGLGVDKLNFVLSVSESHNRENVRCSVDESMQRFEDVMTARQSEPGFARTAVTGGVSTAFGCTIEGAVDERRVYELVEAYLSHGADEVVVADTVGYANPAQVKRIMGEVMRLVPQGMPVVGHFHDTRGLGLANVTAALEVGVRHFDASLAGLGGCPFAPNATGNVVMDDLVFMLEAMGLATGVDLDRLLAIREILQANLPADEPMHGLIARAGVPKDFRPASAN